MSDQPTLPGSRREPPRQSEPSETGEGGTNLAAGGDVSVGGDVAGRDVIKNTTTQTVTNIGFNEKMIQRLLITVGAMVFVTAACFFSGGIAVGAVAFNALGRDVGSSQEAALRFQQKLAILQSLPPGQAFELTFTEDELSSYVKFILSPQLGFTPESGRARLLPDGEVVVAGQLADAGNLQVAGTFELQDAPGQPLKLKAAAVQALPAGDSVFGWVAVPAPLLQPVEGRINSLLGNVQLTEVSVVNPDEQELTWQLEGVTR
jgi:hypothetical protein